jgi:hypothetical protein
LPPLVFTVSITGHQDIAPVCRQLLQDQVTCLLRDMRAQLIDAKSANSIDQRRALTCRFVSALAPGADQIGARAVFATTDAEPAWKLHAVLPFGQSICSELAANSLRERGVTDQEIASAQLAMAELAGKADRLLELADWQPGDQALLAQNWQSRRYATIGQMLVRQADILIGLWDGNPPRGQGGTADVISEARRNGVPVIWIDPSRPDEPRSLVPDADSRHLPASDIAARHRIGDSAIQHLISDGASAAITAAISQVLLGNDTARAICVQRYLDEDPPEMWAIPGEASASRPGDLHGTYAFMLYGLLNCPTRLKRRSTANDHEQGRKPQDLRSYPFQKARRQGGWFARCALLYPFNFGVSRGDPCTANAEPLLAHAERADAVATRLGNQYRSAYVLIFTLAPVAVMLAVVSALIMEPYPALKPWLVVLELLTVGLAASIYLRTRDNDPAADRPKGRRWLRRLFPRSQDTHHRWLDARLIAESQRSGQLLAWIGFSGRRPIDPVAASEEAHGHIEGLAGHGASRTVWAPHYANAIAALPDLPLDQAGGRHTAITPMRVMALAQSVGQVIADQLSYHDLNHQRLAALNHRLDSLSLRSIQFAAGISAFYLVLWLANQPVPAWAPWSATIQPGSFLYYGYKVLKYAAAFGGAVLPAVAAAAAGIRFQGDFERFAMRSKDTADRLRALAARAERIAKRARECGPIACSGKPPLIEPMLGLLLDTQSVLDEDLADWRFAYSARPITFG